MKRLLICIIMVLCVCVSACTGKQKSEETENAEPNDDWGIALEVRDPTPTGLTLLCTHHGDGTKEVPTTGSRYRLEVWENDDWQTVPYIIEGNVDFTLVEKGIVENSTISFPHRWDHLYGELPAGTYRIAKLFDIGSGSDLETKWFYAEFTLK